MADSIEIGRRSGKTWRRALTRQPPGVYLMASVEVWERTSFYGMLALLALFLVAAPSDHGFGWSNDEAVRLVGIYISLIYGASIFGGWLADRFIGSRRALTLGGISMCVGHFLMAGPAVIPRLIESMTGVPIEQILRHSGYPLARLGSTEAASDAIEAYVAAMGLPAELLQHYVTTATFSYLFVGASFFAAIIFLVLGTGLFKPNSYVVVGSLYRDTDPERESGFTLHYMGINAGALLGPLIVGGVGELIGWHYGFTFAGFGMAVGLVIYLKFQRRLLGDLAPRKELQRSRAPVRLTDLSRPDRERLVVIIMLSAFAAIFWTAFYQMGGLLNLYTLESVDRSLLDVELPASWFQALNPFYVIVFSPLFASLWVWLARRGRNPELGAKFSIGLALMGLCFLAMVLATYEQEAAPTLKASMAWLVLAYLLMTLGELCLSPVGNAAITRLAPKPIAGAMMGVWFLSSALAGWLSGEVGASAAQYGPRQVFSILAVVCGASAVVPLLLSRWMGARARMPRAEPVA